MLKFSLRFTGEEKVVEFESGRSSLWRSQDYGAGLPASPSKQGKTDFAWGYFAARQAGRLEELGVPDGMGVDDAIEWIADNYDLYISDSKKDADAPLAAGAAG